MLCFERDLISRVSQEICCKFLFFLLYLVVWFKWLLCAKGKEVRKKLFLKGDKKRRRAHPTRIKWC